MAGHSTRDFLGEAGDHCPSADPDKPGLIQVNLKTAVKISVHVTVYQVTLSHLTCVTFSTVCRCPSGFWSRLRLLHSTVSMAQVQPTSKMSAPQWSIPPVEQTSVRPIAVTCSSREPGHSSVDEASALLLQLSGTVCLFICAHHPSVEDNSELGWKPALESDLF